MILVGRRSSSAFAAGSRQGKVVPAQHHSIDGIETGGSRKFKGYVSREQESDGEVVGTIELRPLNPECAPIVLGPGDEADVQVIAEFVSAPKRVTARHVPIL